MEIIVGKTSGFCFGVKRAVEGVSNDVKRYKKLKCLGDIVHNEVVVNDLKEKGVIVVNSLDEVQNGEVLAIRAHGIPKSIYDDARKRNITLIDYTCPKVDVIHMKIEKADANGYQVIIIGKKIHPETIGSKGFSNKAIVIENKDEIDSLPDFEKVYVIVQTTFSKAKYLEMEELLKNRYSNIICDNTICQSTKTRQDECRELAKKVDFMIIIGGKESSNTQKLYEVAKEENENSIIIQDENDKKIEESAKYDIIGIMSGASTPDISIQRVIEKLKSF